MNAVNIICGVPSILKTLTNLSDGFSNLGSRQINVQL